MKKLNRLMTEPVLFVLSIFSACISFLIYTMRINAVYIDTSLFSGFSAVLFGISVVTALAFFVLFLIKAYYIKCNGTEISAKKTFVIIEIISVILEAVFFIYTLINLITSNYEFRVRLGVSIGDSILPFLAVMCIVLLAWGLPLLKKKAVKCGIALGLSLAVLLVTVFTLFPYRTYKFLADPAVFDNGESYSVVFATNDTGTGFLEYTFEGKKYTVYDETAGRIDNSTIHTVKVPKEHLNGNTYHVGSLRVIEERSYGGRNGKEIYSKDYTFKPVTGDEQTYLSVSDWHLQLKDAYKAVEYAGDYDGVILLGDAVPGLENEEDVAKYIVAFGGEVSKGVMPVLYVRGNHETRGPVVSRLPEYLGMDSFYYTAETGNYSFIVLDSGDDKEDDSPMYGGLSYGYPYRIKMADWLDTLEKSNKKTLTLVHMSDLCIEDDLREHMQSKLKSLDATNIISGHEHTCEFVQSNGFNIYLDGGHSGGTFTASKITLTKDAYLLEAWNSNGEQVFQKQIAW